MARKRKRRIAVALLSMLAVYAALFFVWSRARTFELRGEQRRVWSFFAPPAGLSVANPARWRKWKRNEQIAAVVFWPCVLLDEKLTARRYWPAQFSDAPRF